MTRELVTVREDITVAELCELLQLHNINGAPVVDRQGVLLGVVTQDDIIYGAMGSNAGQASDQQTPDQEPAGRRSRRLTTILKERRLAEAPPAGPRRGEKPFWTDARQSDPLRAPVSSIMTSPAIAADEETPVAELCRIMWNLRIHRVPIVSNGKVTGLVSSMDLCRAILAGQIKV